MSVAFPALVLFMYVLPGIIFRRSVSTAGQFRQHRSVADELAQGVVLACVGHALWISISNCFGRPVDLQAAVMSAVGQYGKDSVGLDSSIRALTENVWWVLWYFISLNGFAFGLGRLIRWARDRNWRPLKAFDSFDDEPGAERFKEWSGILVDRSADQTIVPLLSTVVELGGVAHLFVGCLEEIHWSDDGHPDRFVLSGVIRRLLADDEDPEVAVEQLGGDAEEEEDGRFYSILGDKFIIRATEAKTLNILIRKAEIGDE
jgi:hypothetical protein